MIISAKLTRVSTAQMLSKDFTHMQPTLQISILVLYVLDPSKTSGARYHSVTT